MKRNSSTDRKDLKKTKPNFPQAELSDIFVSLVAPFLPPKDFGKLKFLNSSIRDNRFFAIPHPLNPTESKQFIENLIRGILIQGEKKAEIKYLEKANNKDYTNYIYSDPNFHCLHFLKLLKNYKTTKTPTEEDYNLILTKFHLLSHIDPAFCYNIIAHSLPLKVQDKIINHLLESYQYQRNSLLPNNYSDSFRDTHPVPTLFIAIRNSLTSQQFNKIYDFFLDLAFINGVIQSLTTAEYELLSNWAPNLNKEQINTFYLRYYKYMEQNIFFISKNNIKILFHFYQQFDQFQKDNLFEFLVNKEFDDQKIILLALLSPCHTQTSLSLLNSESVYIDFQDDNDTIFKILLHPDFNRNPSKSISNYVSNPYDNQLTQCAIDLFNSDNREKRFKQLCSAFVEMSKKYITEKSRYTETGENEILDRSNRALAFEQVQNEFKATTKVLLAVAPALTKDETPVIIPILFAAIENELRLSDAPITSILHFDTNIKFIMYVISLLKDNLGYECISTYIDTLLKIPTHECQGKIQSYVLLFDYYEQFTDLDKTKIFDSLLELLTQTLNPDHLTQIDELTSHNSLTNLTIDILKTLKINNKFQKSPYVETIFYLLFNSIQSHIKQSNQLSEKIYTIATRILKTITPSLTQKELQYFLDYLMKLVADKDCREESAHLFSILIDNLELENNDYSKSIFSILLKLLPSNHNSWRYEYDLRRVSLDTITKLIKCNNNLSIIELLLNNKFDEFLINSLLQKLNANISPPFDLNDQIKMECLKYFFEFLSSENQELFLKIVIKTMKIEAINPYCQNLIGILKECAKTSKVKVPTPEKTIFGDNLSFLEDQFKLLLSPEKNASPQEGTFKLK